MKCINSVKNFHDYFIFLHNHHVVLHKIPSLEILGSFTLRFSMSHLIVSPQHRRTKFVSLPVTILDINSSFSWLKSPGNHVQLPFCDICEHCALAICGRYLMKIDVEF